jgi:hypothetical protein
MMDYENASSWDMTDAERSAFFLALHAAGAQVVPIGVGDKKPLVKWGRFQQDRIPQAAVDSWWGSRGKHRGSNAAILLGRGLGRIVVDADSVDSVAYLDELLPAAGITVQTGRGEHRYYQYPTDEDIQTFGGRVRGGVAWFSARTRGHTPAGDSVTMRDYDIKGDGGYVLAPGSIHKTGKVYQAKGATPADFLAYIAAEHGGHLPLSVFDADCFCGTAHTSKCRNDTGLRRAVSLPPSTTQRVSPGLPPSAPGSLAVSVRRDSVPEYVSPAMAEFRASRYLDRVDGAVEGAGGDIHTYKTACVVVRGFDLSDDSAFHVLSAWNERCAPPWTDAELRTKIRSARETGSGSFGYLLDAPRDVPASIASSVKAGEGDGDGEEEGEETPARAVPSFDQADRVNIRWLINHYVGTDSVSTIRKMTRLSYCGIAAALTSCSLNEAHTDMSIGKVCCEDTKRCPYCAGQHARVQAAFIAREWAMTSGEVAVLRVPMSASGMRDEPARTVRASRHKVRRAMSQARKKAARAAGTKGYRPDYRWVVGHEEWLMIMPVDQGGQSYLQAGEDEGHGTLSVMSPAEVGTLISEVWQQPALYLQKLLKHRSMQDIVEFADSPYMSIGEGHYPRTAASRVPKGVPHILPWPSLERVRAELTDAALERRGGIPLTECAHHDAITGEACRAPLKRTYIDTGTGELLCSSSGDGWRGKDKAFRLLSALHESTVAGGRHTHHQAQPVRGP